MRADKKHCKRHLARGRERLKMVALAKNPDRFKLPDVCAPFARQTPGSKQINAPNPSQPHQRARYYDNHTGEFISRDPSEYVDGMSLFRGYLGLDRVDPRGSQIIVTGHGPARLEGNCGKAFGFSWNFKLPEKINKDFDGWIVQEVTVICQRAICKKIKSPGLIVFGHGCPTLVIEPDRCECTLPAQQVFKYYEAWFVGAGDRQSKEKKRGKQHHDSAFYTPVKNTCGSIMQIGDIRFFNESQTGDLRLNPGWKRGMVWGLNTQCPTSSLGLLATNIRPTFWDLPVVPNGRHGSRLFQLDWRCCDCDPPDRVKGWGWPEKVKE